MSTALRFVGLCVLGFGTPYWLVWKACEWGSVRLERTAERLDKESTNG